MTDAWTFYYYLYNSNGKFSEWFTRKFSHSFSSTQKFPNIRIHTYTFIYFTCIFRKVIMRTMRRRDVVKRIIHCIHDIRQAKPPQLFIRKFSDAGIVCKVRKYQRAPIKNVKSLGYYVASNGMKAFSPFECTYIHTYVHI